MALDQNITYRVNLDDSNFNAKLTQMRASIDSTVGGAGGGFSAANVGMMGLMNRGSFGTPSMSGGFADFGGQVAPVSYNPPAQAFQPHFGMFQIQQTLGQAGLTAGFGMGGIAAMQLGSGMGNRDVIPPNMSYSEYINYSTRAFADRVGGRTAAVVGSAMGLGASLLTGAVGTAAGTALGTSLAGSIGGTVGGFIGGGLIAAPIGSAIVGAGVARGMDNLGIQATLEAGSFRSYQGSNVDPLTGRGFNRQDRYDIATNIMRQESNDNRFNTTDYKQIMETGMQMDLFSGTRDADDFGKKFKDLVSTVKTVTSTLHTSLKEGMETIRGLRDMGVTDASTQQAMVLGSETLGRMSGRTGMEMMAVGQTGAEMFRGTGISMQRGFEVNQQNTALVRSMLNSGAITRETVAQAGGELGLAQQMTANSLSSFQTLQGRGAMMAAFNPATGSLDPNMLGRMMSTDSMSILSGAAGTMTSPGNMFKFQAHQEEMISKLDPMTMTLMGAATRMSTARTLANAYPGVDMKDAFIAMSRREGVSMEQVNAEIGMMTMDPQKFKEQQQQQINNVAVQQNLEAARDTYAGTKLYKNAFTRAVVQPIGELVAGMGNSASRMTEDFSIYLQEHTFGVGMDTRHMNGGAISGARDFMQNRVNEETRRAAAAAGRPLSENEQKDVARKAAQRMTDGGVVDLSDGFFAGIGDAIGMSSHGTTGTAAGNFLRAAAGKSEINGVQIKRFETEAAMKAAQKNSGETFYSMGKDEDGKLVAFSGSQAKAIMDARRSMQSTREEIDAEVGVVGNSRALRELRQSTDPVTLEAIGKKFVKDFDIKKYKRGEYSHKINTRLEAAAEAGGFTAAMNEVHDSNNFDVIGGAMGAIGEHYSDAARRGDQAAGSALRGILNLKDFDVARLVEGGAKGGAAMRGLNLIAKGDGNMKEAMELLRQGGIKDDQIAGVVAAVRESRDANGGKGTKRIKEFIAGSDSAIRAAEAGGNSAQEMSGSEASSLAGVAGPLTAAQMEVLVKMAKGLEQQIEILSTLQKKLSDSFKK